MNSLTAPLSDAELDQLAAFLDSLPSPEAMNIERLDGFFCALVASPDLVMPSEYWPYVIGDDTEESGPTFDTMEQAQTIMSLVTRHWNTIATTLQNEEIYLPVLLEDDNGLALGNDWAKGFMDGVALRSSSWQSFLHDEDHAGSIIPMMALAHENDPEPQARFESPPPEKRTELLQMMVAGITQIYRYFEPMRAQSTPRAQTFVRSQPKIGRNDPCPCGSGKKYKQCCMTRLQ
jgi:uncharacterized protein